MGVRYGSAEGSSLNFGCEFHLIANVDHDHSSALGR